MKNAPDFTTLPVSALDLLTWPWEHIAPYYADLLARDLTPTTLPRWLADWSRLQALVTEATARLNAAAWANTADQAAQERRRQFYATVRQPVKAAPRRASRSAGWTAVSLRPATITSWRSSRLKSKPCSRPRRFRR